MSTAKTVGQALKSTDPLNLFGFGRIGDTSAEDAARARAEQLKQIQDELDFAKTVYSENAGQWDQTRNDIFGVPEVGTTLPPTTRTAAIQLGASVNKGSSGAGATPAAKVGASFGRAIAGKPQPIVGLDNPANGGLIPPAPASPGAEVAAVSKAFKSPAGPDTSTLPGAYRASEDATNSAVDDFVSAVNGIQNPDIAEYVGDTVSQGAQAGANPEDIAAQRAALGKLDQFTGIQETAEERLIRELARRKQEADLQSQREALKNSLQSRGAYGSGAEVAGLLSGQQASASARALEELGAQANAQQRAMAALGKYSDLATAIRNAGAQESQFRGNAADITARTNQGLHQQAEQFKTRTKIDENRDVVERAARVADARTSAAAKLGEDAQRIANTRIALTSGATGSNVAGAAPVESAHQNLAQGFGTQAAVFDASTPPGGLLFGDQFGQGYKTVFK